MAKVLKMQFSPRGSFQSVVQVCDDRSFKAAKDHFWEMYYSLSEDYFVELWNDFVFSVPAFNCVYVLRDLD